MFRLRSHHDFRSGNRPPHKIVSLNRCACRRSTNHPAPLHHLVELAISQRVRILVNDVPPPSAVEPRAARVPQRLGELFRIRHFRFMRVQHVDIRAAQLRP